MSESINNILSVSGLISITIFLLSLPLAAVTLNPGFIAATFMPFMLGGFFLCLSSAFFE